MDFIFYWFILAILTAIAAVARGRDGLGWFLIGIIFGVFSLIAVLIMPNRKRDPFAATPETHLRCPDCQELVLWEARVCKHCGCRLKPPPKDAANKEVAENESIEILKALKPKPEHPRQ